MPLKHFLFFSAVMLTSAVHAENIDLSCTNNSGTGRTDIITFDASARTLTWAQHPESPLHINRTQKTGTGYVLWLPDTAANTNLVVYINGKESRIEVHNGIYAEKDPCHVIGDWRKPASAESVPPPATAAPFVQDRAKQQEWMFHTTDRGAYMSAIAADGASRVIIACEGGTRSVGFTFYPDGYRGHALNKVLDLEQPFIYEVRPASGNNQKFSILAYMVADSGWPQQAGRHLTGSEASAFLDAVGQDGRLGLQTGKGVEIASWTLKGTSKIRESLRDACQL